MTAETQTLAGESVKGLVAPDDELKGKLKRRNLMSEGENDKHCFVRPGRQTDGRPEDGESSLSQELEEETLALAAGILITPPTQLPALPGGGAAADMAAGMTSLLSAKTVAHLQVCTPQGSRTGTPEPTPREHREGHMHFSNTEPPLQRFEGSPVPSGDCGRSESPTDDLTGKLEFEWQFEILNSLPRERAIALVHYLQNVEQDRSIANGMVKKLQQSNRDLERQVRRLGGGSCCCSWFCCLGALVVPMLLLLAAPYLAAMGFGFDAPSAAGAAAGLLPEAWAEALVSSGLGPWTGNSSCSAVAECPGEEFDRIKSEHMVMKVQLDRLHMDIDDAVHRGQEMVCWKV